MQDIQLFFNNLSGLLWGWPMIIILLGTHVFLTIRLKFPQRKIFKGIALSVKSDGDSKGDVSQFGALATALAATIGTGNIIGVATAISLGGPGAVLWCWLSGVFGIATKYSEGLLAVKYRVKTSDGTMMGGPMYALEGGLHMKWLAILFCVFTVFAALGIGCSVQANSISTMMYESFHIPHYVSGIVMTVLVALVIFFGIKGIARVCSILVPFMAVFYILGCLIILVMNAGFLGEAVSLIVKSAFSAKAVGGG
ncbi:MAG: alanine:cation symporter family protein, partial [Bacteroidales bacterium]